MMSLIKIILFFYVASVNIYSLENLSAESMRLSDAVVRDSSVDSIFFNPANLKDIKVPEVLVAYNVLYPNLTDNTEFINNSVAFAQRALDGGLGFGFNQFGIKDWYIKNKFLFSYGRQLKEFFPKFTFGLKFIYAKETYNLDDYMKENPVFLKGSELSYFSVSLGGVYMFNDFNYLGFRIDNLTQPEVGLYTKEKIPLSLSIGYKYEYRSMRLFPNLNFEFSKIIDYTATLAFEYRILLFNKKLKFSPSLGIGYGKKDYNNISLGFGLYTSQISFNYGYAFAPMSKVDTGATQCISLSYKFLPQPLEEEKISKKEYDRLLLEKQQLEEQLKNITSKQEPLKEQTQEVLPPQPVVSTTEEILLKKIEELERKLKEAETRRTEEKPRTQTSSQPSVTSQPAIQKKRYHTVVEGDTLPKLSEKYYGDSSQWRRIYEANKDKIIRGQLVPGTILEIP